LPRHNTSRHVTYHETPSNSVPKSITTQRAMNGALIV
jgi:hypothetical protein